MFDNLDKAKDKSFCCVMTNRALKICKHFPNFNAPHASLGCSHFVPCLKNHLWI